MTMEEWFGHRDLIRFHTETIYHRCVSVQEMTARAVLREVSPKHYQRYAEWPGSIQEVLQDLVREHGIRLEIEVNPAFSQRIGVYGRVVARNAVDEIVCGLEYDATFTLTDGGAT